MQKQISRDDSNMFIVFDKIDIGQLVAKQLALTFVQFGKVLSIQSTIRPQNHQSLIVQYASLEDVTRAQTYFFTYLTFLNHQELWTAKFVTEIDEPTRKIVSDEMIQSMEEWREIGLENIEGSGIGIDINLNLEFLKDECKFPNTIASYFLSMIFNLASPYGRIAKIKINTTDLAINRWYAEVKTGSEEEANRILDGDYSNPFGELVLSKASFQNLDIECNNSWSIDFTQNTLFDRSKLAKQYNLSWIFSYEKMLDDMDLETIAEDRQNSNGLRLFAATIPLKHTYVILVSNIANEILSNICLTNLFGSIGNVESVRIMEYDRARIKFKNQFSALYALQYLNGIEICGRKMVIEICPEQVVHKLTQVDTKMFRVHSTRWRYPDEDGENKLCHPPVAPSDILLISNFEECVEFLKSQNLDDRYSVIDDEFIKAKSIADACLIMAKTHGKNLDALAYDDQVVRLSVDFYKL